MLIWPARFWDPITKDWLGRGAVASDATIAALNNFFASVRAESGLLTALKRLNLMCGNSAASMRKPQIVESGGADDTETGAGALTYTETGAGGGIIADGTNYLNTGFQPGSDLTSSLDSHFGIYVTVAPPSGANRTYFGARDAGGSKFAYLSWETTPRARCQLGGSDSALLYTGATNPFTGHWLAVCRGTNDESLYEGSTSRATDTAISTDARPALDMYTHCYNDGGSPAARPTSLAFGAYHIGTGLTTSQISALVTAMETFQDALSRGVA